MHRIKNQMTNLQTKNNISIFTDLLQVSKKKTTILINSEAIKQKRRIFYKHSEICITSLIIKDMQILK